MGGGVGERGKVRAAMGGQPWAPLGASSERRCFLLPHAATRGRTLPRPPSVPLPPLPLDVALTLTLVSGRPGGCQLEPRLADPALSRCSSGAPGAGPAPATRQWAGGRGRAPLGSCTGLPLQLQLLLLLLHLAAPPAGLTCAGALRARVRKKCPVYRLCEIIDLKCHTRHAVVALANA